MEDFTRGFCNLIEQKHTKIQISGKSDPQKVGDQQIARGLIDSGEPSHGDENCHPQDDEDDKCCQIHLSAEKHQWPQEIEEKLYSVSDQCLSDLHLVLAGDKYAVRSLSHQQIQHCPHDGEYPTRR